MELARSSPLICSLDVPLAFQNPSVVFVDVRFCPCSTFPCSISSFGIHLGYRNHIYPVRTSLHVTHPHAAGADHAEPEPIRTLNYLEQHPLAQVPSDVFADTFAAAGASQQPALQDAETDAQQSHVQASQSQIPVSQQQLPSGQQLLHSQAAGCPLQHASETRP